MQWWSWSFPRHIMVSISLLTLIQYHLLGVVHYESSTQNLISAPSTSMIPLAQIPKDCPRQSVVHVMYQLTSPYLRTSSSLLLHSSLKLYTSNSYPQCTPRPMEVGLTWWHIKDTHLVNIQFYLNLSNMLIALLLQSLMRWTELVSL